ncbi:MAG: SpoIID/LytB domain-containing protein [Tepidisphaeraceae bacterium]|jgi:stage II sporulation protein D
MRYLALGILVFLLAWPPACTQDVGPRATSAAGPRIRVRLLESVPAVRLASPQSPSVWLDSAPVAVRLAANSGVQISLASGQWILGGVKLSSGVLTIRTASPGPMRINGVAYRGFFCFVPVSGDKFDAVNDVEVDDYLKGVVPAEMYPNWHPEAYKAQAVAARTYALYESRTAGANRYWDVYADARSQMYGGLDRETAQARQAVDDTAGIVLTYGPGDGKIFKAYFSSCCGGVTQAAADAFPGEPYIQPLAEQNHGRCCNQSKYFNWGPITLGKQELTRRIRLWAQRRSQAEGRTFPEATMAPLYRIDVQATNRYGRPSRVLISDARGTQYSLAAEEMRGAINTDAPAGTTLPSSFCKINGDPNADAVTFYDGHGFGHGVGMCQWCAEALAAAGHSYEQILLSAYPQAKLVRAY